MSRNAKEQLFCAFIDATQAYARVDRSRLWERLENIGMPGTWINIIKGLYEDNRVILK